MRRALGLLLFALLVGAALTAPSARSASPDVVVSQVYAGGGNAGAPFANDFVELFNRGSSAVDVAGFRTGPAWFSVRPDKAFHEYMAQWMDRPVDGALGGETFRDFRITVDYPAETAVFER